MLNEATISSFRASLRGGLSEAGDPNYDASRKVYNGMIDRHPALIIRCSSPDDVARAIAFGRDHGAPIAVRGGGHNGGGLGVVDDGVVIDLSSMADVVVDPDSGAVRVGGGATWPFGAGSAETFGKTRVRSAGSTGFTR